MFLVCEDFVLVLYGVSSFLSRAHSCFSQNSCRREKWRARERAIKPGSRLITTKTRKVSIKVTERMHPYVHLLKCKALAGPNIHPSYNPSVNRLWSFRLSWVRSTQPAERGGSAACEWSCVEAACIMSSIHKKCRGEVMASDYPAGCCPLYKSLFCVCDRQLVTSHISLR